MKRIRVVFYLAAALIALVGATGCGHSENFKVKGTIEDGSSINLRFVYMTDGAVRTGLTASVDGKFEFAGVSAEPTVVEVYDNDYRLLGRFVARNGEDIGLTINRRNLYEGKADGNEMNRRLTEFYNGHAETLAHGSGEECNALIAAYVAENAQSAVGRLLLATDYDGTLSDEAAAELDSLMRLFEPEARLFDLADAQASLASRVGKEQSRRPVAAITYKGKNNTNETFVAARQSYALVAVSSAASGRDSVLATLRRLSAHEREGRFALLDLSVDADTVAWTRSVRRDSASWRQGWAAGSVSGPSLGRMGIPALPYFVVLDSAGHQLWRGREGNEAAARIDQLITNNR